MITSRKFYCRCIDIIVRMGFWVAKVSIWECGFHKINVVLNKFKVSWGILRSKLYILQPLNKLSRQSFVHQHIPYHENRALDLPSGRPWCQEDTLPAWSPLHPSALWGSAPSLPGRLQQTRSPPDNRWPPGCQYSHQWLQYRGEHKLPNHIRSWLKRWMDGSVSPTFLTGGFPLTFACTHTYMYIYIPPYSMTMDTLHTYKGTCTQTTYIYTGTLERCLKLASMDQEPFGRHKGHQWNKCR